MNLSANNYFTEGCGRCPLGSTPNCKVHKWALELKMLRNIVLDSGLTETSKWGAPCYTFHEKNVLMISAFKNYCSISFFKGSLLSDTKKLLVKQGPNSQAARLFKFNNLNDIEVITKDIKAYIIEAIEIEKAGHKVSFKKNPEPIPEELMLAFKNDPVFKIAFNALTPGRQRGYILHFSQPKQAKTRLSRIKKCTPQILNGVGLHDAYESVKKIKAFQN